MFDGGRFIAMRRTVRFPAHPVLAAGFFIALFSLPALAADALPRDVPRHAAEALALAQKWQRDAVLI